MVNTVLGTISGDKLGTTLMHEHITWDWDGAKSTNQYSRDEVINTMMPYLLDLKNCGCSTFVDATTLGAGRDIDILIECARKSGLNIITNIGVWDGGDTPAKYTPEHLMDKSIDEISDIWTAEFFKGIEGTGVKPGFIKMALGDTGTITEFQENLLRAAARTSIRTKLPLQCHTFSANSAVQAVGIIEEEKLSFNKFIWVHADGERDFETAKKLADRGIWVEFDCLARTKEFSWHVDAVQRMIDLNLSDRLLISQDAGCFYYGEKNDENTIFPYSRIFKEFIPMCREHGISQELLDKLLIENPARVLDKD